MSIDHTSPAFGLRKIHVQAGWAIWALLTAALALPSACGGSTQAVSKSADATERASDTEEPEPEAEAEGESEAPARVTCDDGTCSTCGNGICPSGWYCDQNAKGGPACGWVPECVKKPSCACLKKTVCCIKYSDQ